MHELFAGDGFLFVQVLRQLVELCTVVGEDLDVLIELCDRIMVMNSGKITGIVDGRTAKKDEIGILMTKNTDREGKA